MKVVKIVNSEENPEDEEPDCICSGVNLKVKDKNDDVTRHLKIFMELCIRKEHDTQCIMLFVTIQVKTFMALCASGSL